MDHPKTTPEIIEPKLYGRETEKKSIIDGITHGKYFADDLVVLPIVGPGVLGRQLSHNTYKEVKGHFAVTIWVCVSLNFNASRVGWHKKL